MGANSRENGLPSRVWAPHTDAVFVIGSFNDWAEDAAPMTREDGGSWHADLPDAKPGDEYRYLVRSGESGRRQYNTARSASDRQCWRNDRSASTSSSGASSAMWCPLLMPWPRRFGAHGRHTPSTSP
jgi:1,4-alpha-glucan branching enzyme